MRLSIFLGTIAALASLLLFAGCGDTAGPGGGSGGVIGGFPPGNCGMTGAPCAAGFFCDGMACVQSCTNDSECATGACCSSGCYDTSTSQNHCGGCGMGCAGTQECRGGVCNALVCNNGTPPNQGIPGGDNTGNAGGDDAGMDDDAGVADPGPAPTPMATPNGCATGEECRKDDATGQTGCVCGMTGPCPAGTVCNAGVCLCGAAACLMNQTCCGGTNCADLSADSNNCGACGNACGAGLSCIAGTCRCPDGQVECNGSCVDINSDTANCGVCGNACAPTSTCSGGSCQCSQGADYLDCDGQCNPIDDAANCGACGNVCMNDKNTVQCYSKLDGMGNELPVDCHCFNDSYSRCDGGDCVRLAQGQANGDSVEHCGACGNTCDGGANVCDNGACRCPDQADTECNETCVDLQNDEANCGACGLACGDGEQCSNGVCSCDVAESNDPGHPYGFCPAGGGAYSCQTIDDELNCGYACQLCNGPSFCDTSGNVNEYACTCNDNALTYCGLDPMSPCVDTDTDSESCGACGFECVDGSTCVDGSCDCGVGRAYCQGDDDVYACIATNVDVNNCGGCGIVCDVDGGEQCCGGSCLAPTDNALSLKSNCGSCNTSCPDDPGGLFGIGAQAGVCNYTCNGAQHTGYTCGYEDNVVNSCP